MQMLKLTIKVQSITDIITNSSSETFCKVRGNDEETTQNISDIFRALFIDHYDADVQLAMRESNYDPETGEDGDVYWLLFEKPCWGTPSIFYIEAIEAILIKNGITNYEIEEIDC